MCKEYNGYSNYETWNASLWIDNDEGSQSLAIDLTERSNSIGNLAESLESMFLDEFMPECVRKVLESCSMFSDIFQSALDNIDWYEIAKNFWEEYHTEDNENENDDIED